MPNVELTTIAEFIAKLEASEPVESAQRQTKYFGESGFTTLTAAKASAAADYTEFGRITNFVIASDLAVSGTDNTGPHLVVKFEGNGRITTQNAGDIFTINRREGIGSKQVFFGPGRVQYAKGAANEMFNLGEWVPEPTTATPYPIIEANHWEGMRWSLYNNNGGRVWVPNNYYYTNEETEPQIGGFMGFGSTDGDGPEGPSANTKGPGIEQLTAGKSIFKIKPGARNVVIEGLRLTLPEGSSGSQVLIEGEFGVDPEVYGIEIERCTMTRGRSGVRVNDTSGAWSWLVMHVKVRRCEILHHTVASVETNTVNGQYTFESLDLTPVPNGTSMGFKFDKTGKVAIRDCNMNGVLQSPATKSFTFAPGDVNVAGKKIVKAGTGLASYDSIFLSNSGGDLPDGWSATVKYYVRVSGNDHTLHRNVADVTNNENAVDPVDQGTGTHTANSVRPNGDSSQPYCGIYIGGPHAGISVYDWQDEGVSRFIVAENTNDYANTIKLDNCFGQGQCYFKSTAQKLSVELVGGKYHWRSFHDEIGANVRLRNYGAKFYTYGDNGPINDYGGFACPVTPRFDDFIGGSYFARDDNDHRGNMSATRSNDTFFWGLEKIDPESNNELSLKARRTGSGPFAGAWDFVNSMDGVDDAQAIAGHRGAWYYKGRLMDIRPTDVIESTSGVAVMNLRLGDHFKWEVDEAARLDLENITAGAKGRKTLEIITTGTTSFPITFGNGFVSKGVFHTGNRSGATYFFEFHSNGTTVREISPREGLIWSPAEIPGCVMLLDARAYSGSDGSMITGDWPDWSPTMSPWELTGSPTFETNELNGKPAVHLGNDSDDSFAGPDLSWMTEASRYRVYKSVLGSVGGDVLGTDPTNKDHQPYDPDQKYYSTFGTTARKNAITADSSPQSYHVMRYRSAAGHWSMHQNGVELHSTGTNTFGFPSAPVIGNNGTDKHIALICFDIIFCRILSAAEDRRLMEYIDDIWGVGS